MQKWKRVTICAVSVVLLCALPSTAMAHPGRTDSDGGHYNRSTGEYHYHHGMEAHQHPGGVCPYAYGSGYSYPERTATTTQKPTSRPTSSYAEYYAKATDTVKASIVPVQTQTRKPSTTQHEEARSTTTNTPAPAETAPMEHKNSVWDDTVLGAVFAALLFVPFLLGGAAILWEVSKPQNFIDSTLEPFENRIKKCSEHVPSRGVVNIQPITHNEIENIYLDAIRSECMASLAMYKQIYPHGVDMDEGGLPHQRSIMALADPYIVHYNTRTKVYHTASCRYARTVAPVHVTELPRGADPCGICRPSLPDLKWFQMHKYIEFLLRIYTKHKGVTLKLE